MSLSIICHGSELITVLNISLTPAFDPCKLKTITIYGHWKAKGDHDPVLYTECKLEAHDNTTISDTVCLPFGITKTYNTGVDGYRIMITSLYKVFLISKVRWGCRLDAAMNL